MLPSRLVMSPASFSRLTRAAMLLLGVIVVTGAAVRLTGSGLGCPTWPQCGDGSLVTRPEYQLHGIVEFGNRAVSILVGLLVLALPLLALGQLDARGERRRDLVRLGFGLWLGYLGQIVLGGLTVLFHLNPALVAGHFLLSMLLLLDAVVLDNRARTGSGRRQAVVAAPLLWLSTLLAATCATVLLLGTVVTGSGPHAGDATHAVHRFGFPVRAVAQLHADVAMLLVGLTVATMFGLYAADSPTAARRTGKWLAATVLGQAALGFVQYFAGIPVGLVAVHVAGATLLWVLALQLRLSLSAPATAARVSGPPELRSDPSRVPARVSASV